MWPGALGMSRGCGPGAFFWGRPCFQTKFVTFIKTETRWWFQICFIFTPTWGNDPVWLIFSRWIETTNQESSHPKFQESASLKYDEILCLVDGKIQFLPGQQRCLVASSLDRALDLLHLVFLNMMYEDVGHQWHWLKDFSYFSAFCEASKTFKSWKCDVCWIWSMTAAIQHALSHPLLC